jgi:lactate dehydrogenase-like 2-hydroxyacid dehydrogenase
MGLLKITQIQRNNSGEIISVILEDGNQLDLQELFEAVEQGNIGGAFIDVDAVGNKHLHIISDGDTGDDLDCLSLI